MTDEGYFVKYFLSKEDSPMVVTVHQVQVDAEQKFPAEILYHAGRIVDQFLTGKIDIQVYEQRKLELASKTNSPELLKRFLDCHPLRKIRNPHKIQVSL